MKIFTYENIYIWKYLQIYFIILKYKTVSAAYLYKDIFQEKSFLNCKRVKITRVVASKDCPRSLKTWTDLCSRLSRRCAALNGKHFETMFYSSINRFRFQFFNRWMQKKSLFTISSSIGTSMRFPIIPFPCMYVCMYLFLHRGWAWNCFKKEDNLKYVHNLFCLQK
jgi:hypothetical protein